MTKLDSLEIPDGIYEEQEGHELVRFWISSGVDHVTLNVGLFDRDQEPEIWGSIAADIVKHAVRGMLQDDDTRDEKVLFAQIERAFSARFKENVVLEGQLRGDQQ